MYLTPQRFREMGLGIDTSELDDSELLSLINQATAVVNAYCNVPRIPQMHDFRGGTITSETHTWRYPVNSLDIGQRREYLFHWPILAISNFRIYVTNTQYIEIAPTELMIPMSTSLPRSRRPATPTAGTSRSPMSTCPAPTARPGGPRTSSGSRTPAGSR
jgi:hypothetical protein